MLQKKSDYAVIILFWGYALAYSASIHRTEGEHVLNVSYNLVILGVGLLLVVYTLGEAFIPVLKYVKNKLSVLPEKGVGEFILTLEQMIEKWGKKHIRSEDRQAAFGFKTAAGLLPLFYRVFQLSGFPHLYSAFTQGLKPFQKITPDSPLGKAAGIEQPMRLGLGRPWWLGFFPGKKTSDKQQLHVLSLANEQKKRVEMLSQLMTYYALSNQTFDIKTVLIGSLAMDYNFNYTKKMILDFTWVSQELSQYILKSEKNRYDPPYT